MKKIAQNSDQMQNFISECLQKFVQICEKGWFCYVFRKFW